MTLPVPADVLSYCDRLPLSWTVLPVDTDAVTLERMAEGNVTMLARLVSLEERPGLNSDAGEIEKEIYQLSNKVDLLIEMVAAIAREQRGLPPSLEVCLSAQRLSWRAPAVSVPVGGRLLVSLYMHPCLSLPLQLPVTITACADDIVTAQIEHPTEACASSLEQHVFLHHRRAIADSRKPSASPH